MRWQEQRRRNLCDGALARTPTELTACDDVGGTSDGLPHAAAVLDHVAQTMGSFVVNEHRAAAHLGVPLVRAAAGRMYAGITDTYRRKTIRQNVGRASDCRADDGMRAGWAAMRIGRAERQI